MVEGKAVVVVSGVRRILAGRGGIIGLGEERMFVIVFELEGPGDGLELRARGAGKDMDGDDDGSFREQDLGSRGGTTGFGDGCELAFGVTLGGSWNGKWIV